MALLTLLRARLLNQPLLCTPDYVEIALSGVADRLGIEPMVSLDPPGSYRRPAHDVVFDKHHGIVTIPIVGALAHRGESATPESGLAAYTGIQNDIVQYMNTASVRGILLDVDSPGGEVAGLAELAEFIAEAAKEKPIYAVANSLMASAAYWMSSGATRIYAAPNSAVGSIGVVTAHVDRSKELEKRGQKVTLIHAGAHKIDGNPYEALPDDVRAGVQARVDHLYGEFVNAVATNRDLDEKTVRKTEAGVFSPATALDIGLVDGVATYGEALRALQTRVSSPTSMVGFTASKEPTMAERTQYGESDLNRAREEGRADAEATAKRSLDTAVAKATADFRADIASAIAALFPDNERAATFADALQDGASIALAQKTSARIPLAAATAEVAPQPTRTQADFNRLMEAHAPNVRGDDTAGQTTQNAREKRLAELSGTARGFSEAKGYRGRVG